MLLRLSGKDIINPLTWALETKQICMMTIFRNGLPLLEKRFNYVSGGTIFSFRKSLDLEVDNLKTKIFVTIFEALPT